MRDICAIAMAVMSVSCGPGVPMAKLSKPSDVRACKPIGELAIDRGHRGTSHKDLMGDLRQRAEQLGATDVVAEAASNQEPALKARLYKCEDSGSLPDSWTYEHGTGF